MLFLPVVGLLFRAEGFPRELKLSDTKRYHERFQEWYAHAHAVRFNKRNVPAHVPAYVTRRRARCTIDSRYANGKSIC